jgi:hypothetical protein
MKLEIYRSVGIVTCGSRSLTRKYDIDHNHVLKKYGAIIFGMYRKIQRLKYTKL